MVADDDGVVVVPRERVAETVTASQNRVDTEDASRAAFHRGQLGLDRYELRPLLNDLGVEYKTWADVPEAR
jgi:4-hydroxy-4-methyl-2-oxoglutarate aldolase